VAEGAGRRRISADEEVTVSSVEVEERYASREANKSKRKRRGLEGRG
jgi:hypothetical protein